MAILHKATLSVSKVELLQQYIPTIERLGVTDGAGLTQIGAYRFDDPAGEVGIESHIVATSDGRVLHMPFTYRAAPLPDADEWLVATLDHSVLGRRWVYDACGDPVYCAVLADVIRSGGIQAELEVHGDDGVTPRANTVFVQGSGSAASAYELDDDGFVERTGNVSQIFVGDAHLVVRHQLDPELSVSTEHLAGTWPDQDTPVILAHLAEHDVALARRQRSVARLTAEGVPFIEHLPAIDAETNSLRRTTAEVAERAVALLTVAVKGEVQTADGSSEARKMTDDIRERFGVDGLLSPAEQAFIETRNPSEHDTTRFTWRYEALWTLMWALGFVDELGAPSSICDAGAAVDPITSRGHDGFMAAAQLRSQTELLDEADLIYRYGWASRNASLQGTTEPGLDPGVTMERHHTLNWLIGDHDWDDVPTDT